MSMLITSRDPAEHALQIGGKAANLFLLQKAGLPVPPWAVIPAHIPIALAGISPEMDENEVIQKLHSIEPPADIMHELTYFFGEQAEYKKYAVRSSAVDEDGAQHSFAGQYDTFLNVPFDDIAQKIKEIWLSVTGARVITYRRAHKMQMQWGISVIIQEMLLPDVSGVAFGIDPVSGNRETKVINAVFGAGEGLVSGKWNADTFICTPGGIEKKIVQKPFALYATSENNGLQQTEVPDEKQNTATLSEEQIQSLCSALQLLEDQLGTPQDVEFVVAQDDIWYVQTRPVTTVRETNEEYILWDNSNIVESYPGITTPLTFSFITKMYASVYKNFVALLGVSPKQIKKHAHVFDHTLGLVRGRVYYNLLSWYKMLAMVPGYSINAAFMENMMGVKERFVLREDYQVSKQTAWLRTFWIICSLLWLQFRLPAMRRQFRKHLEKVMAEYEQTDLSTIGIAGIVERYIRFERTLVDKWKAPLINDFFAMIWFGLLQKQTAALLPKGSANVHNDLLCNSRDIISVEPVHRIMHITEMILSDPDAYALFSSETAENIYRNLDHSRYKDIQNEIRSYIQTFGERCIGELKLETESIAQNPLLLIATIQAYVKQGVTPNRAEHIVEHDMRKQAEELMQDALRRKPIKKLLFRLTLRKARDLISNRENLRFERTRGFGMVRKMFYAIGQKLQASGLMEEARDVFYLTLEEIIGLRDGLEPDLRQKITERKAEFATYRSQPVPKERFYTYGIHFTDAFIYSDDKMEKALDRLQGIGCCPGEVEGIVRVVSDPLAETHLQGDILVTASTDPGWITLFPTASAILVERGSLLSHSAIVSRELGIPCIVGITGLLRSVKTGDKIYMNGSTGEIKLLSA